MIICMYLKVLKNSFEMPQFHSKLLIYLFYLLNLVYSKWSLDYWIANLLVTFPNESTFCLVYINLTKNKNINKILLFQGLI